jgi:pyruvate,water dikinase
MNESPVVLWFREIRKSSLPLVGGKGANLGEMTNAGFPIPPGFCVTTRAYWHFLEETGLKKQVLDMIEAIDVDNTEQLEQVTAQVREMILKKPMSMELQTEILKAYHKLSEKKLGWLASTEKTFVAVRSSATAEDLPEASFAGQQDSYLNIVGDRRLVDAVKRCWASLFTARATYYRKKQGFPTEKVGISVVVQKMVESDVAGVMFTADPTGDESKIIIEAAFGLGDMVVSGSVTPDTYVLDKGSVKILRKRIGKQTLKHIRAGGKTAEENVKPRVQEKQKLDDKLIVELARIGKQIENHYKDPQDIEWALEEGHLFIVQSRAVTTLEVKKKALAREKMIIKTGEKPILRGSAASPGIASNVVRVIPSVEDITRVQPGEIIATTMTSPDWVPVMRKSAAIITNEGGNTCHAAIVSRELGIPCVVGTANCTETLKDGEVVTVDGYTGVVYRGKVTLEKPEEEAELTAEDIIKEEEVAKLEKALVTEAEAEVVKAPAKEEKKTEAESEKEKEHLLALLEQRAVKVKVNVALPDAAERAAETGADGVGLLRAEHMITESGVHPAEFIREGKKKELVEAVKKGVGRVVKLFEGKPVWYRTFDARTDEFRQLKGGEDEPEEGNPMLGWHGIRRSIDEPELIKAEFTAIKELVKEGYKNIGVMLPFLVNVEELQKAKGHARSAGLKPGEDVKFGVMIETPASALIIDDLIKDGIDFISFGTNDLTQLTLGIDRNNERIQRLFNAKHPAVLALLEFVIKSCKAAGVTTSICGQAASDPEMVKHLVRWGIDSVSANIDAVQKIKETVLLEEKRILLEEVNSKK